MRKFLVGLPLFRKGMGSRLRGKDRCFAFFLLFLCPISLPAYKFICNSIDAHGNVTADQCGVCNEASGPRWIPGRVRIKVDTSVLPKGVDVETWMRVVERSIQSWNEVPGSHLKLALDESKFRSSRGFGEVASKHEIFWITDKIEWRRKIGSGEHGALGVTTSPYFCPRSTSAREIYDADLVMNGVGNFRWAEDCDGSEACNSILSTLTHELGHFVGLGHPCQMCSWSIMSAQSAFHIKKPVFDDQEALRALYPGGNSGAVGMACGTEGDICDSGLECVEQEGANYCAPKCNGDSECPEMLKCVRELGRDGAVCKFATGRLAEVAKLHEHCGARPCEDELLCVGSGPPHFYCHKSCGAGGKCGSNEGCVPLQNGDGVCMEIRKLDESCDYKTLCAEKLICALAGEDRLEGKCHRLCFTNRSSGCRTGEHCSPRPGLKKNRGICVKGALPVKKGENSQPESTPRKTQSGRSEDFKPEIDPRPQVVSKGLFSCQSGGLGAWWVGWLLVLGWFRLRRKFQVG